MVKSVVHRYHLNIRAGLIDHSLGDQFTFLRYPVMEFRGSYLDLVHSGRAVLGDST